MSSTIIYNCHYNHMFPTTQPHFLSSPFGDIRSYVVRIVTYPDFSKKILQRKITLIVTLAPLPIRLG